MSLEAELVMRDGEVVGTKNPTGHSLLVDCRFELPFGKYLASRPTSPELVYRAANVLSLFATGFRSIPSGGALLLVVF